MPERARRGLGARSLARLVAIVALAAPAAGAESRHADWDALLRAHVRDGRVDYDGLAAERARLDAYLDALARADTSRMARDEELALWIDAYNACTVALILDHGPNIESILDIPKAERWKAPFCVVAGRRYSLDEIEHEIIRPRFADPRVHFALNCASVSCPPLASEAYVGPRLDAQLDAAARRFVADRRRGVRIERRGGSLHVVVSRIFDWYGDDFGGDDGIFAFLERYAESGVRRALIEARREGTRLEFMPYDWSLNGSFDATGPRSPPDPAGTPPPR